MMSHVILLSCKYYINTGLEWFAKHGNSHVISGNDFMDNFFENFDVPYSKFEITLYVLYIYII